MSEKRVRALLIQPEYPYSFWSLPEARGMTGTRASTPPLGLITLAALLPADWELKLVDLNVRPLTPADWDFADTVLFSGMINQQTILAEMIREARERGKTVVVGGPVASSSTKRLLEAGSQFVVKGEAENVVHRLVAALAAGEHGLFEDTDRPDLAASPIPRFDLLDLQAYGNMAVQTSRGCPHDCEFCDIVSLHGRKPRHKTPEQVLAELETLYRLGYRGAVFVVDDNFIGHRPHARAILEKLIPWSKERGEPFGFNTQATVTLGQDLEMIDLLTRANFGDIFVGIESPNPDSLRQIGKHQNLRGSMSEDLAAITKNGLTVQGSFIIGFDDEQPGAGERVVEFAEKADLPMVMVNILFALPNTRLWKRLEAEGRLLEDFVLDDGINLDTNIVSTRPLAEIQKEAIEARAVLYEPSRYLARTYRHCLTIRPTRAAQAKARGESLPKEQTTEKSGRVKVKRGEIFALLRLVWRQGLRAPYRGQFWRQLIGMMKRNPSRLKKYLTLCVVGEDLFRFRRVVLDLGEHLAGAEESR